MALPSLSTPEFNTTIPSSGEKITYRPFLVKEEKILLMAMEGNDPKEIEQAIKKILNNCILSGIDVDSLTSFDMEFLFLQLRGKSVGEQIQIKVPHPDPERKEMKEFVINIDDIAVSNLDQEKKLMLTDDVGVMMKYPTMQEAMKVQGDDMDAVFSILAESVDYVFDKESVYNEFSKEELVEWISSLNQEQFKKILDFFENMPKVKHDLVWEDEETGKTETITLEGIQSFFM